MSVQEGWTEHAPEIHKQTSTLRMPKSPCGTKQKRTNTCREQGDRNSFPGEAEPSHWGGDGDLYPNRRHASQARSANYWHGHPAHNWDPERQRRRCAPAIVRAMGRRPRGPRHTELPLAALATRAAAWMRGADETLDHRAARRSLDPRWLQRQYPPWDSRTSAGTR